ncbi:MAG TPA: histidine kinase dimerization/phospho-acceptor domain-containing protein, partial [Kofleriaceae bacterium]|nr:histidine kinase dimerization/phospho-acceptor domain-containing protein [Kofleriaceae bacterium]
MTTSEALVHAGDPQPLRAFERIARPLTRRSIVPFGIALTLVIGVGDRLTGVELPFTILYVLPIGLGTWFRDRRFGMVLAALSTICIAISLHHDRLSSFGIAWNVGGAALLFLAVIWCVDQLHAFIESERAQRRMAVDQLRHAERLNMIGTLAAGVAHELGTPLNVIAGCAELIAEDTGDATLRRRTSMIIDQVSKVSSIIRQLLDFGHRGAIARTTVEVNALARSTVSMLE